MFISGHQEGSFYINHSRNQTNGEVTISNSASCYSRGKANTKGSHIDNYMVQLRSDSGHFHPILLARIGQMVSHNYKRAKKWKPTICSEGEELEMFDPQTSDRHLFQD